MLHDHPANYIDQTNDFTYSCFATAAYALIVAMYSSLHKSFGVLVFCRYVILNIPLVADLHQFYA
jgi:hypothetical protein